jgi:hypothetical protein
MTAPNQASAAETATAADSVSCKGPPEGAGILTINQMADIFRACRKKSYLSILDALSWMYAKTITIHHHPARDIDGVLLSVNQIAFERALALPDPQQKVPASQPTDDIEVTVVGNVIVLSETTHGINPVDGKPYSEHPVLLFPYRDGKLLGSIMWYDASTLPPSVQEREDKLKHILGK